MLVALGLSIPLLGRIVAAGFHEMESLSWDAAPTLGWFRVFATLGFLNLFPYVMGMGFWYLAARKGESAAWGTVKIPVYCMAALNLIIFTVIWVPVDRLGGSSTVGIALMVVPFVSVLSLLAFLFLQSPIRSAWKTIRNTGRS